MNWLEIINRRQVCAFLMGLFLVSGLGACTQNTDRIASQEATKTQLIISAASSLKDALQDLEPLYKKANSNVTLRFNFASSGALQQQIEQGAPADVFISAATKQINALQKKNLILTETKRDLLSNQLVLITPVQTSTIKTLQDLQSSDVQRIAIGDPKSVPVGQYATETFRKQNLADPLQSKLVLANNVRQVLQFVESGNAQAGIVYLTDAKTAKQVRIAQTIPENLHAPIVYPVAIVKNSKNPEAAKKFTQFLSSPDASKIFVNKYGFRTPG
jgi:molybdate transport system substrate-binding protein